MNKKRIYIAYTGGTIGMQRSEQGYVPAPGFMEQCLQGMPEFHRAEMPDYFIHEYAPLIDSSDMTPADWQRIAEDIRNTCESAIDLAHSLFYCLLLLVSFTQILWSLSGVITVTLFDTAIAVPGHMVFVSMLYASAGTTAASTCSAPVTFTLWCCSSSGKSSAPADMGR